MTDIGILFSAPMALALLREVEQPGAGKTQTRRIIKPQPGPCDHREWPGLSDEPRWKIDGREMYCGTCGNGVKLAAIKSGVSAISLRYAKGDRLWVREAWRTEPQHDKRKPSEVPTGAPLLHLAGTGLTFPNKLWGRYRHGRYMPRWASRLTLTVTDVRVQRLQDIRHADAKAEGVLPFAPHRAPQGGACDGDSSGFDDCARCAFKLLWADIHGGKSWFANPWVTATTFAVALRNIDA